MTTENRGFGGQDPEQEPKRTDNLDYLAFVEAHEFGPHAKAAKDVAVLLNDPNFAANGKRDYDGRRQAELREKAFNAFCRVCAQAGVELPPLESQLYEPFLPSEKTTERPEPGDLTSRTIVEQVEAELTCQPATAEAAEMRAILKMFELFPIELSSTGYSSGLKQKQLVALLNHQLLKANLQPVRPNYQELEIKMGVKETGPEQPTKIVIVDDDQEAVLKSALRVAGWPNVSVEYALNTRQGYGRSKPEELQERMSKFIDAILEHHPDVVLMDSGLDFEFKGEQLIEAMQQDPRASKVRFVANTGGSPDGFEKLGTYSNFNKGESMDGLRAAVSE